jgi:hypothetical protein
LPAVHPPGTTVIMSRTRPGARTVEFAAVAGLLAVVAGVTPVAGQPASCARADFEAVVDEAAGSLRELNQTNKPNFQDKLRLLKDKRGWSHEQFLQAAAPFVQDEKISEWDQRSADLLSKITAMGQEGSSAKAPDCAMLNELHGHMKALVEAQQAKWTYMFAKIDAELAK